MLIFSMLTCPTAGGRGGLSWGTAMECQQANCGTVPTHHYINTKLTMSAANPNCKNTLALNGASGSLVTADGLKTWTVADVSQPVHLHLGFELRSE